MVQKMGHAFPVVCITAPGSGYGKTRLLEYLVSEITATGRKVCVIKHSGHEFTPDEGKDTLAHRRAGARASGVLTRGGLLALFIPGSSLEESLGLMGALGPDLVLCEGFKGSHYPKVVILDNSEEFGILPALENVIAVLSQDDVPGWVRVPVVRRKEDALAAIIAHISAQHGGWKR